MDHEMQDQTRQISICLATLLYASETWTISNFMKKRLVSFELWTHRRMLKDKWINHTTNNDILKKMKEDRPIIMDVIQGRRDVFKEKLLNSDRPEKVILTEDITGKKTRGRQRRSYNSQL